MILQYIQDTVFGFMTLFLIVCTCTISGYLIYPTPEFLAYHDGQVPSHVLVLLWTASGVCVHGLFGIAWALGNFLRTNNEKSDEKMD